METNETNTEYVGRMIKDRIRDMRITNGYVIHELKQAGMEMTDTKFSNKLYGDREKFNEVEVKKISKILKTDFSAGTIN